MSESDYSTLSALAEAQDHGRQRSLAAIDRLEGEVRLALANLHSDPSQRHVYAAILRRCAAHRAQLLGSLASPQ